MTTRFYHSFSYKSVLYKSILLVLTAAILISGCSASATPISHTDIYFDTVITISIYDSRDKNLLTECFALAAKYDKLFNKNQKNSDIWNINHSNTAAVSVDSETIALLKEACYYAELSHGLLDPTIGSVSSLWNFHASSEPVAPESVAPTLVLPSSELLAAALHHVDYKTIIINETDSTITLTDPLTQIDLGFIAKGYIANQIKDYLTRQGVTSALINLGGNIQAIGTKPDGSDFAIGIQKPFADSGTAALTLSIADCSVVSAGTYERYFMHDNVLYHHILDTATGYPVDNSLASVTVIAQDSTQADALSTWCMILGLQEGMRLIASLGNDVGAIFITQDGKIYRANVDD